MRPVARIAQSVEQGIENPRVLGSIPSPGTTIQRTRPKGGFLLLKNDNSDFYFRAATLSSRILFFHGHREY